MKPDYHRVQLWWCDPATKIYKEKDKYGIKGYHFAWQHNTMNALTACNLMEEAFLMLDEPVWTPDPGFNFTSIYYLLRHGMTHEQVKLFLTAFNSIVREKLLLPYQDKVHSQLISHLELASDYTKHNKLTNNEVNIYPAKNYRKAVDYFIDEYQKGFSDISCNDNLVINKNSGYGSSTMELDIGGLKLTKNELTNFWFFSRLVVGKSLYDLQ